MIMSTLEQLQRKVDALHTSVAAWGCLIGLWVVTTQWLALAFGITAVCLFGHNIYRAVKDVKELDRFDTHARHGEA